MATNELTYGMGQVWHNRAEKVEAYRAVVSPKDVNPA